MNDLFTAVKRKHKCENVRGFFFVEKKNILEKKKKNNNNGLCVLIKQGSGGSFLCFECVAVMLWQCVGTARAALISLPLKCCRRELVKWSYPLPHSPRGSFLFDLAETGAFQSTTCLPYEMLWLTVKACQLRFNRGFFCDLKGPRQALNCCNVAWHNRHSFIHIVYQLSLKIKLNMV